MRAVDAGRVHLLVVANDASDRLQRQVNEGAEARQVPILKWGTKAELGTAVGKRDLGVVAVCDTGFAGALMREVGRHVAATGEKGLGDVYV